MTASALVLSKSVNGSNVADVFKRQGGLTDVALQFIDRLSQKLVAERYKVIEGTAFIELHYAKSALKEP